MRSFMTTLLVAVLSVFAIVSGASIAAAQTPDHYRGFWVDTFNTNLNNHAEVLAVINNARAANANAIFAQVRRRGDSWYLNSLEPKADRTPIVGGFDPLQDLIQEAHANGIEMHAFVAVNAIWGRDPRFFPPESSSHVFNQHGGYNRTTQVVVPGPNNWLTRTLLPDNAASMILNQGHRIGGDFWIDPGHPDAAAYTVNVLTHLVRNYDIDGLHLDRIRYPELSVSGQTPSTGASIGYNPRSVSRFNRRYGITPETANPAQNNALWSQWRRDQVSSLVRRIYLNAIAVKPNLKVSAATIAFGGGPASEAAWNSSEAFWRVYQDWRAWTSEGIIDIAMPMVYKREHTAAEVTQFNAWLEWTRNHQYNRSALIGIGAFLNSVEGSIRQTRRSLAPSALGNMAAGVAYFSMATSNVAVTANPFSLPAGQNTPARSFLEFASGLTTGRSVNGSVLYESPLLNPIAVFPAPVPVPAMPWKSAPQVGHIMGAARNAQGNAVDSASVMIERIDGPPAPGLRTSYTTTTDGGGFYGAIDLAPGTYRVYIVPVGLAAGAYTDCVDVVAGAVSSLDIVTDILDNTPPQTTAVLTPQPNAAGWANASVQVRLTGLDNAGGSGVEHLHYFASGAENIDETEVHGGETEVTISAEGATTLSYSAEDQDCNHEEWQSITIRIDRTAPSLELPADIQAGTDPGMATAVLNPGAATGSDELSGVDQVVGTREDGLPLTAAYPVGQTRITWTVTDKAGNSASAVQTITVSDREAPVISGLAVDTPVLETPNHRMVDVTLMYTLSDNYDPASGISTSASITSSEPQNGTGDGDTDVDWEIIDQHHIRLRAERAGNGEGRIYTITVTATDRSGNTSSRSVTVTVPHSSLG